jgi:hypothetical protein
VEIARSGKKKNEYYVLCYEFFFPLPFAFYTHSLILLYQECFEKGPLPADVVKAVEDVWVTIKAEAPAYHF